MTDRVSVDFYHFGDEPNLDLTVEYGEGLWVYVSNLGVPTGFNNEEVRSLVLQFGEAVVRAARDPHGIIPHRTSRAAA